MNLDFVKQSREHLDDTTLLFVACEEMGELIQAISKTVRQKPMAHYNLVEEIADVLMSIEYVKSIFNVDEKEIDEWIKMKQRRINERIQQGNFS